MRRVTFESGSAATSTQTRTRILQNSEYSVFLLPNVGPGLGSMAGYCLR
jgi:hypothetical protein